MWASNRTGNDVLRTALSRSERNFWIGHRYSGGNGQEIVHQFGVGRVPWPFPRFDENKVATSAEITNLCSAPNWILVGSRKVVGENPIKREIVLSWFKDEEFHFCRGDFELWEAELEEIGWWNLCFFWWSFMPNWWNIGFIHQTEKQQLNHYIIQRELMFFNIIKYALWRLPQLIKWEYTKYRVLNSFKDVI